MSTIRSVFASVKNKLSTELSLLMPTVLLANSAAVPIPKPAAKLPKETIRPILEDGTVLGLADLLS